jgi:hypothetical protein
MENAVLKPCLVEQILPHDPNEPPSLLRQGIFPLTLLEKDLLGGFVVEVLDLAVELQSHFLFFPREVQAVPADRTRDLKLGRGRPDPEPEDQFPGERFTGGLRTGVRVLQCPAEGADTAPPIQ